MRNLLVRKKEFFMTFQLYVQIMACVLSAPALLCVTTSVPSAHAATAMSASLHRSEIQPGETTQLSVTVSGSSDTARPLLPQVDGLRFTPRGQSTQMQYTNGRLSTSVTFVFQVDAEREGTYDIPPIQMRVGGEIIETDPMTLTVTSRAAPAPPAPGFGLQGRRPSARQQGQTPSDTSDPASLTVRPARNSAYVGEFVPVEIKALFEEGMRVTLSSRPSVSGGAVTVHSISNEPRETQEIRHGRTCTVLIWNAGISGAKEGRVDLTGNLSVTLLIREHLSLPDNPLFDNPFFNNDLFGRDVFNDFFGGMKEKTVNLSADPQVLEVLPLPEQGKTPSFNGAIGSFSMKVSSSPASVRTGDPVTVRAKISGAGNFDRVSKPIFSADRDWKTYNPGASFKPLDDIGYQGEKIFEQVIIPQSPDLKEVPPLVFSYFDPASGSYREIRSDPVPLTVTGTDLSGVHDAGTEPAPDRLLPDISEMEPEEDLAPVQIERTTACRSLQPVFLEDWFIRIAAFFGVLFAAGAVSRFLYRKRMRDPAYASSLARQLEIDHIFAGIEKALNEGDATGFLRHCRRAAQLKLGALWKLEPDVITLSDLDRNDSSSFTEIRRIFEMSDAVSFSGQELDMQQLKHLFSSFKRELEKIR